LADEQLFIPIPQAAQPIALSVFPFFPTFWVCPVGNGAVKAVQGVFVVEEKIEV